MCVFFVAVTPTVTMTCFPSSASASSCSSSSTSHLASPPVCLYYFCVCYFYSLCMSNKVLCLCGASQRGQPNQHILGSPSLFVLLFFLLWFLCLFICCSLSPCLCSSLLLRVSICVPKLWPPLHRRPLVFSSRTHLEAVVAARTPPPVTPMTLSWCQLISSVRNYFCIGSLLKCVFKAYVILTLL